MKVIVSTVLGVVLWSFILDCYIFFDRWYWFTLNKVQLSDQVVIFLAHYIKYCSFRILSFYRTSVLISVFFFLNSFRLWVSSSSSSSIWESCDVYLSLKEWNYFSLMFSVCGLYESSLLYLTKGGTSPYSDHIWESKNLISSENHDV